MKKDFPDVVAVLPAAGVGSRMKHHLPKQYYIINDKTLLEHAVDALMYQPCIKQIIVVINCCDHWFHKLPIANDSRISVVVGGKTRADSVMIALEHIHQSEWVIIHDAVRPCLHQDDLLRLLEVTIFSHIGGILAIPVSDTIKRAYTYSDIIHYTIERKDLWRALTPQLFNCNLLKKSLAQLLERGCIISDEAAALEMCGYHPQLIIGRSDNIKVTYPEDLILADVYLSKIYAK
ncbi:2-C-methyl-D-erythritol 4-phosphate cytidylyltransferase [Blochmannia endosymbiont of Camponotus (Colobopsis) obliquus]|uniref:2-C-methyl-D-erythritol 4-phosphate cytidylyltransferase n=1 Tax=Blochmannia endosymbiont of Camponotus (Colobopsis) obliquus TaxID=1505597 RepID=UPI00061A678D|nr:2-C-methyl-D-erythritol 4-phosphate cytidylyltransferase [Blochmannia endosymbiont of Camponotus (Colobopsis) obliquus]AKC60341.1 2-C-methyl-D-erythritol 4-phosphate cytidylyltransferase [Blochmannia endosymbiont of Camponotus (Colobopsis) obliquus]